MCKLTGVVIFAAGMLLGGISASVITKRKYEKLAEEEIQSVKEMFKRKIERDKAIQEQEQKEENKQEEIKQEVVVEEPIQEEPERFELIYDNMTKAYRQNNKEWVDEKARREKVKELLNKISYEPEVIDPEEFGETGYDMVTLTYFADGVIADDLDEIVDDYEQLVGREFIKIFNDFDATTVYVRNEYWEIDYEIVRDDWFFTDIQDCPLSPEEIGEVNREAVEKKPHQL